MIDEWKRAASQMDGTETPLGFVQFAGVNCETKQAIVSRNRGISGYPEIATCVRPRQQRARAHGARRVQNEGHSTLNTLSTLLKWGFDSLRKQPCKRLNSFPSTIMLPIRIGVRACGLSCISKVASNVLAVKASLQRMSASIGGLVNVGVFDCDKDPSTCWGQYVGNMYPVLKLCPYKGDKDIGDTLLEAGVDPLVMLPVVEQVIRMCLANVETKNGLMKTFARGVQGPRRTGAAKASASIPRTGKVPATSLAGQSSSQYLSQAVHREQTSSPSV